MPTPQSRSKGRKLLINGGFTEAEARELSMQYSIAQMRSLPYLIKMRRTRRLSATRLASYGYGLEEIQRSIAALYIKKGWTDVWSMLRSYRTQSIESGDYIPPKRSHHSNKEITQSE